MHSPLGASFRARPTTRPCNWRRQTDRKDERISAECGKKRGQVPCRIHLPHSGPRRSRSSGTGRRAENPQRPDRSGLTMCQLLWLRHAAKVSMGGTEHLDTGFDAALNGTIRGTQQASRRHKRVSRIYKKPNHEAKDMLMNCPGGGLRRLRHQARGSGEAAGQNPGPASRLNRGPEQLADSTFITPMGITLKGVVSQDLLPQAIQPCGSL